MEQSLHRSGFCKESETPQETPCWSGGVTDLRTCRNCFAWQAGKLCWENHSKLAVNVHINPSDSRQSIRCVQLSCRGTIMSKDCGNSLLKLVSSHSPASLIQSKERAAKAYNKHSAPHISLLYSDGSLCTDDTGQRNTGAGWVGYRHAQEIFHGSTPLGPFLMRRPPLSMPQ